MLSLLNKSMSFHSLIRDHFYSHFKLITVIQAMILFYTSPSADGTAGDNGSCCSAIAYSVKHQHHLLTDQIREAGRCVGVTR